MSWAIYGASGYTGALIAKEAVARGEKPLLFGRSEERLRAVAEPLGLSFTVVDNDSLAGLVKALDLVVNVAGPFSTTMAPVLDACIRGTAHYLDLSNEFESVQQLFRDAARVRAVGITAVPAVGFGTVASDAVAAHAVGRLNNPVAVEVATFADNASGGPATTASVLDVLGRGGVRIVDGAVQRAPLGRGIHRINTPLGGRSIVPVATGDLVTVRQTTGMRTVSASVGFAVPAPLLISGLPAISFAARTRLLRGMPDSRRRAEHVYRSYAWARATDADGSTVESWLETGEGYAFSASAAVSAVQGVLANPLATVATIATVLGTDFALSIEGTTIAALDDKGRIIGS
jgi:short subunit dehydrogenase-like uncharacterized protein